MLEVQERPISHEEAYKLVERMIDKQTTNYIIREVLMDKGFSAHSANELISEVRRDQLTESKKPLPFDLNLGTILVLLAIIALIFYVLVSNLT